MNFKTAILAGTVLIVPVTATAMELSDASGEPVGTVFTMEDFSQFSPSTALDMVSRIPGFAIREENSEERGLGQAEGNVLINGRRVAGKSLTLRDALNRIPATNVEKIELVDGATLDIPGLSGQVANVIATVNGVSGTWEWRSRFRENLPPYLHGGNVSVTGRQNTLAWTLGLKSNPIRGGATGPEYVYDANRNLIETRDEDVNNIGDEAGISGALEWTPLNGSVANLNAEYNIFQIDTREISERFPEDGSPARFRRFNNAEDEWNSEIGGDFEFALGPGRLKTIALWRFEHSPVISGVRTIDENGNLTERSIFEQTVDEGESILRSEYGWQPAPGRDWQIALEGAFNFLEAEAALQSLDGSGVLVPVPLDKANSRVEEKRAEINVTHGRRLSGKLSVQASLGAEYSELSQSGGASQTREFTRPKGFLSAAYEVNDKLTVNAKLAREVGQLDFFDFISSVNVNSGNGNQGNPDIVPQQSWEAEVELEKDFGPAGAHTIKFYYENIEDIVDRVPFGPDAEGPGNLDEAKRYGIATNGTFKFAPLGLEGLQLEYELEARKSEIEDPLTGETRRINDDLILGGFFDLRYDVPNTDWAVGFGGERFDNAPFVRLDERHYFELRPVYTFLYLEHKDIFGMTGQIEYFNVFDADEQFTRQVYTPRRDGALLFREDRSWRAGPILSISLKGSF
ncbi:MULTISPECIES: TonB-dependent receptor plug domain-containing protein [Henriciella]|uniref:TonB-dependent receptor plug domain-containing protein n=1 Tax=Henriciella TaxID=453849 RepID=UPI0035174BCE